MLHAKLDQYTLTYGCHDHIDDTVQRARMLQQNVCAVIILLAFYCTIHLTSNQQLPDAFLLAAMPRPISFSIITVNSHML